MLDPLFSDLFALAWREVFPGSLGLDEGTSEELCADGLVEPFLAGVPADFGVRLVWEAVGGVVDGATERATVAGPTFDGTDTANHGVRSAGESGAAQAASRAPTQAHATRAVAGRRCGWR